MFLVTFGILFMVCSPKDKKNESNTCNNQRIQNLIYKMSLKEKVGQLTQINLSDLIDNVTLEIDEAKLDVYVKDYNVGSFLNTMYFNYSLPVATPNTWIKMINLMQKKYQDTNMKIPMVYAVDSIHGANYIGNATLFPHQLGMASTFNRMLIRKAGEITAKDTRAVGIHWNFSPVLDIAVNKLWSRVYETFGEDPYLVSELGAEIISGYQGYPRNLSSPKKVAATMKHFIAYSATRSGKDVDGSWVPDRIIYEYFQPPFDKAIGKGVATAMESYSDIGGEHVVSSKKLLNDLLREKMEFKGILVTDWGQISKLHHPMHIASSPKEAVRMGIQSGSIDISMVPDNTLFNDYLIELVKENRISEELIDNNVCRILKFKEELGLLDGNIYIDPNSDLVKSIGSQEDNKISLDVAREGVILLKNKNKFLPLDKRSKVMVIGPTSNSLKYLNGGWTFKWAGSQTDSWFSKGTTILNGIIKKVGNNNVVHLEGVDINGKKSTDFKDIENKAKEVDVVVVCLGEDAYVEFTGNINDMRLPEGQIELLETVSMQNKPVVLVLSQGRPRVLGNSIENAKSILNGFLLGPHAGEAFADVIFGDTNPSGKLPLTYSNHVNDNTVNYYRRFNENYDVEWPFGHGMSYTTFEYTNLKLTLLNPKRTNIALSEIIMECSVRVKNTGKVEGKETVLMYITDVYRSIAPEVIKLRGFKKINLKPDQSKNVVLKISYKDLVFHDENNLKRIEAGNFEVSISNLSQSFNLVFSNNKKYILVD